MGRLSIGVMVLALFAMSSIASVQSYPAMSVTSTTCSYFDQSGEHLEKSAVSKTTYLKSMIHLTCISEIANNSGNVIKYSSQNNPLQENIPCLYKTYVTFDWIETINPNGLAILECVFENDHGL